MANDKRQRITGGGRHARTVNAEHISRTDAYGDTARKTFTVTTWDAIPGVHMADKNGITKLSKAGWVQAKATDEGSPAPLKAKKERVIIPSEYTTPSDGPVRISPIGE